jgi:hypothetical protein
LHENRDFFSAIIYYYLITTKKKKNGAAALWSSWFSWAETAKNGPKVGQTIGALQKTLGFF